MTKKLINLCALLTEAPARDNHVYRACKYDGKIAVAGDVYLNGLGETWPVWIKTFTSVPAAYNWLRTEALAGRA